MSANSFEEVLLASGGLASRGKRALAEHVGRVIAALVLFAAGIFTFTDVTLAEILSEGFTLRLLFFALCASVLFFSLERDGERVALQGERGKAASEGLKRALAALHAERLGAFATYLDAYVEEELRFRQRRRLLAYGKSTEAYLSYLAGERTSFSDRLRFRRIRAIKPLSLSAEGMLAGGASEKSERVKDPVLSRRLRLLGGLLPSLLSLFFTVSIAIGTKEMSAAEIAEGLLRLIALFGVGLRGCTVGLRYVYEIKLPWLAMKERLILAFLAADGKRPTCDEGDGVPAALHAEK